MWRLGPERFERASVEVVKEELRAGGWPVYKSYAIEIEDGEAFVVAPVSWASFFNPEPLEENQGLQRFAGRSPLEDAMTFYAPLRTPEVVLELAELAETEITPEAVRDWAYVYGLLGFPDDDTVTADNGFAKFKVNGQGRSDNVRRFAEAAGEVRACLRIYEAITADEDVNFDKLSPLAMLLPRKAFVPFGPMERHIGRERSWLFLVLGRLVQMRLEEYCYPMFSVYTNNRLATGRFALSWGFRGLIGAIWLHIAWLLEAEGENVTRCKLPGCLRVIHFEPGEPAIDPDPRRKNVRGRYKTRSDREFCKGRGCKQKYHYRKKAGWPDYV